MKKVVALGGVALAGIAAIVVALLVGGFFLFAGSGLLADSSDQKNTTLVDGCVPATGQVVGAAGAVTGLVGEQVTNANIIIAVGVQKGIPAKGEIIALAVGLQESGLRNLTYGDRDSLGVFQQRPSQGWLNVTDVAYAAGSFYDGLLRVAGWQSMPVTVAAQKVQRSGFPQAYAKWEQLATSAVEAALGKDALTVVTVGATGCVAQPAGGAVPVAATGVVAAIIAAAQSQLGVGYSWGGGSLTGPAAGAGTGVSGFDCSSFVRYAVYQGTGGAVTIPRVTRAQYAAGVKVSKADLQPGDLLFFASNTSNPGTIHHVALYLGEGRMIHAPKTGDVIKVVDNMWASSYWSSQFIGATRPTAQSSGAAA